MLSKEQREKRIDVENRILNLMLQIQDAARELDPENLGGMLCMGISKDGAISVYNEAAFTPEIDQACRIDLFVYYDDETGERRVCHDT